MRVSAGQQHAQEVAHRLLNGAIANAGARVATSGAAGTRRPGSLTPSTGTGGSAAGRSPSSGSTASSWAEAPPRVPRLPTAALAAVESQPTGARSQGSSRPLSVSSISEGPRQLEEGHPEGGAGAVRTHPPDALEHWMLREELRRASAALARATAAPEVVSAMDLPELAALRAELVRAHAEALERVDDRRVTLQARHTSAQEGPERGRCVACWVRSADRLLLPCKHLCLCSGCLQSCKAACPICRSQIMETIEVYGVA